MKKRHLLDKIQKCVTTLLDLSEDAAKLEIMDNDQASRRIKRDLVKFKDGPLEDLTREIYKTREEIKNKK